ncbi:MULTISPECIES: DUF2141 domain-containing protein [Winogradskyella]|jgi:uncharacterized protein (DUF2141 family)|uniref:DUF2141 domain-containing protein n=1 Tax=Winogradskyella TaxID=286104 RepID=UPI000C89CDDE|nr:DUF2141 domain-containing protein [Winogradskyella sp. MH6]MAB48848.1 hypothetical protein [Flavobacteriaceae bacterium]|tara:strand:+ start:707 stop:1123 length:417 start_codon:yes stop_codon:yes gene_type:complete
MKNLVLTLALAFTSLFSFAQDEGITITVTVDNVTSDKGKVLMSLHTSETFMKGKGIKDAETSIEDGKVTITFENVLPGEYAILALHDENDNKRMDFEDNGMPKESFGMSNNVMAMGPPQYDDAKFTVADKDLDLNIRF